MIIAACYYTQVELTGSFKAYTLHNQCKTIKVLICVFCCATATTSIIKIMDICSRAGFIQSFIRLACEFEYAKKRLPDEGGSQLLSGSDSMKMSFLDLKGHLHSRMRVEYGAFLVATHHEEKFWKPTFFCLAMGNPCSANIEHYQQPPFGLGECHWGFAQLRFDHTKQYISWT